jgi:uncharacterized membrane protein YedE/YeeE|tara:strand:- start:1723 stop:2784 length:1062 start_codon:yes stop_codon:yes gene_type:complete
MFEQFGFEIITPMQTSFVFALIIGVLFGALAQHLKFCFRSAVVGDKDAKPVARGIWFTALGSALLGTQLLVAYDYVTFSDHRLLSQDIPIFAIVLGGLMFGIGMVCTRGCISRLTILAGTGNLRALSVVIVFSVVAHATLKGVFAPVRVWLGSVTISLGQTTSLAALPGGATFWAGALSITVFLLAYKSGINWRQAVLALILGILVPSAWLGTGFILQDDFDPIAMQSLSFTSPAADWLFWTIASSSIPVGFGAGLILGVVFGAAIASLSKGEFAWKTFESPQQTKNYFFGASLMGLGGVLAGGCTIGAGLSGISTLGIAAFVALASITIGGLLAKYLSSSQRRSTLDALGAH